MAPGIKLFSPHHHLGPQCDRTMPGHDKERLLPVGGLRYHMSQLSVSNRYIGKDIGLPQAKKTAFNERWNVS